MIIKKITPSSLFGRLIVILIIPSILLPLIATYAFYERHWKSVTRNMVASLTGEIVTVIEIIQDQNKKDSGYLEHLGRNLGLQFDIKSGKLKKQDNIDSKLKELSSNLNAKIDNNFTVEFIGSSDENVRINLQINNNEIFSVSTTSKRVTNPTTYIYVTLLSLTSAILFAIAVIFTKNQVRSIKYLSNAMQLYGQNMEIEKFKPSGAKEVRIAGENFIRMQESIERNIKQRTEMLAGISHDLRTPLTRINLELALIDEQYDTTDLKNDVSEMEYMIDEYLAFAKGEGGEKPKDISIKELIDNIVNKYRNYEEDVTIQHLDDMVIKLKEKSFSRCISNLIDNALRYGGMAQLNIHINTDKCIITVDDNGPGIAKEDREKIFTPFYRIDDSRNSDTGGVGLGMAITKDIITAHNGEIKLSESPELGGLRVIIELPV